MKANELMIGDWVQIVEPCKYAGAIGRIKTLIDHKDGENAYFKVFLQSNTIHIGIEDICSDDIRPIPLTQKMLEKNGFKWTTHKSYMVSCIGTVHMVWGFYKDCISISDRSDDGDCQISSLKCKFVHQLQHAMCNCEIKKEIEL